VTFVASELDPRVHALMADAGFGALFTPQQHWCCELVEHYVLCLTIDVVRRLEPELHCPASIDELLRARGWSDGFRIPLRWLLARLAAAGLAVAAREGRWTLVRPLPDVDLAALRAEALAADASYAPVYALLDETAAVYPAVARGETTGDAALFRKAALWFAYFSNANAYYALNNRVTAAVAATRVGREATVLEVGAGPGSASEALLELLRDTGRLGAVAHYRLTEPVPLFRRRAERTLAALFPDVPLACASVDVNRPWAEQGVEPASADLVWGVNVFHLARDLDAVLAEARGALRPGGWLVVGEGIRPFRGTPVGAEFPLEILASYTATAGFLTAEEWLAAIRRAGFADAAIVPDAIRLRSLYPGFFAAAIQARRPSA
jgi:SAM-dependent methyltransferase